MQIAKAMKELADSVPQAENQYMGEDGYMHCSVCHARTQFHSVVEALGIDRMVPCVCLCYKKKEAEHAEQIRQAELERKRDVCFGTKSRMRKGTFEADDRRDETMSDAMRKYADDFKEHKQDGTGLLLYGTVGTGKTFYAACIANKLIDDGYDVLCTSIPELVNKMQADYCDKQEILDDLRNFQLVVIDDMGVERDTPYMQEQVYMIIDSRYQSGLPLIVTTNLTSEELKKQDDRPHKRIYDRLLEKCFPIDMSGQSRRRQNVRNSFHDMKSKLGL
jgi:DNA replication protein DnaC